MDELVAIGAGNIQKLNRAVSFSGDLRLLYRSNLELRTALRILVPIARFKVTNESELYDEIGNIDWSDYLDVESTLAVDGVVHSQFFNHSKYVALKTKDAIVDQFRRKTGKRPSVDTQEPDCRLNVHIHKDQCSVSLDSTGMSLHKRGYRKTRHRAPLNEVLAAGLLLIAGYDGSQPFMDPMCGSGTILIEATLISKNIPPGILRSDFAFMNWEDFNADLWKEVKAEALSKIRESSAKILGSDSDISAIKMARQSLQSMEFEEVLLSRKSFFEVSRPADGTIIVSNPPYGERLNEQDIIQLYERIGNHMKRNFAGSKAFFISSDVRALKRIGLKPFLKKTVFNGALECRFFGFDIFDGKRKSYLKSRKEE